MEHGTSQSAAQGFVLEPGLQLSLFDDLGVGGEQSLARPADDEPAELVDQETLPLFM